MGGEKAVTEILKWLTTSTCGDFSGSDEQYSTPFSTTDNYVKKDSPVFSDHLLMAKRFQKTFYCSELSPNNFHSSLALTDVTLELFNRTVPNEGRLDILDMDYASHVSKSICISPCSMILAMMYVEQLQYKNPDYLEDVSPCDLYVVSMLVASKYLFDDDEFTYNSDWADVANLDVEDLNILEKEFLLAMNWELFIKSSDYFAFLALIEQRIALKQSFGRGWLSYTDILIMSQSKNFIQFWLQVSGIIIKVVVIMTVGYVASVILLFGSFSIFKTAVVDVQLLNYDDIFNNHAAGASSELVHSANISDSSGVLHYQGQTSSHTMTNYKDQSAVMFVENLEKLIYGDESTLFGSKATDFVWNHVVNEMDQDFTMDQNIPYNARKAAVSLQEQDYCSNGTKSFNSFINFNNCVVLWPLY